MPTATLDSAILDSTILEVTVAGLSSSPKCLPPWLFYDDRGSQLFEQITELPEYYLTRTERAIFAQHGPSLPGVLGVPVTIAELGAGCATKTGVLLREFTRRQQGVLYQPIDISGSALEEAEASISSSIPGVTVASQVANYITEPYAIERPEGHRILTLYIGSSIGNFSPEEAAAILNNLRTHLEPGDFLLLGTDLAPGKKKSVETLKSAYDDSQGVTAAFNKNILVRLNRELDADFDLDSFLHRVRWNATDSRIEMHLESRIAQTVHLAGRAIAFSAGETIHTENSYKFTDESLRNLLESSGFTIKEVMHDADNLFAVTLAIAM